MITILRIGQSENWQELNACRKIAWKHAGTLPCVCVCACKQRHVSGIRLLVRLKSNGDSWDGRRLHWFCVGIADCSMIFVSTKIAKQMSTANLKKQNTRHTSPVISNGDPIGDTKDVCFACAIPWDSVANTSPRPQILRRYLSLCTTC